MLFYPSVSEWWNSAHQTHAVTSYGSVVNEANGAELAVIRKNAHAYNERLAKEGNSWFLTDEQMADYKSQLVVAGSSVMGYVEIPAIDCTLPIYHGTDESVLQVAVGHIEGSSLPVGGESTHSVVSGHRGLPSAKLFTDLDELAEGDVFLLRVLGETLTYEVDQILTVEPHDVEALEVVEGEDYCTLVTCTPYGVNSHRLLVRGYRVDNDVSAETHVPADAVLVDLEIVAACIAAPVLLVLFVAAMAWPRRRG